MNCGGKKLVDGSKRYGMIHSIPRREVRISPVELTVNLWFNLK